MTTNKKVEKPKEETKNLLPMELIPEKTEIVPPLKEEPKEVNKDEEIESLKKQLEEANKKLQEPVNLEERIQYYQRKQELIMQLDRLISESERLKTIQEEIEECIEDDEFECESYKLSLGKLSQYRNDTVFSMNNPVVIGDVINCVLNRINAKMDKLKTEIAC
ncbi:MAG TPA: hypothetical protein DFK15_08730 [Butyricimonas sp.]|jgi:DNA repair exonuclease SbcCD ATPase subunit|uniref:hypothetical protein n=1 Tax=Butyricimonas TaxID=574697 RepID=UPI000ECC10B3|nr:MULTISPECIES: hypothetical protein [Butyricimonas]MBQ6794486.1 hypothetical protein [Butyricimonas sp.]HAM85572.1 hypothetical protein [Butyricimonas sp.]HCH89363.1 hypothetical protein [Butyricimonas sp.]